MLFNGLNVALNGTTDDDAVDVFAADAATFAEAAPDVPDDLDVFFFTAFVAIFCSMTLMRLCGWRLIYAEESDEHITPFALPQIFTAMRLNYQHGYIATHNIIINHPTEKSIIFCVAQNYKIMDRRKEVE